jgi:hypothetical protein
VYAYIYAYIYAYTHMYMPRLGELGVEEAGREAAELKVGREHLVRVRVGGKVGIRLGLELA